MIRFSFPQGIESLLRSIWIGCASGQKPWSQSRSADQPKILWGRRKAWKFEPVGEEKQRISRQVPSKNNEYLVRGTIKTRKFELGAEEKQGISSQGPRENEEIRARGRGKTETVEPGHIEPGS